MTLFFKELWFGPLLDNCVKNKHLAGKKRNIEFHQKEVVFNQWFYLQGKTGKKKWLLLVENPLFGLLCLIPPAFFSTRVDKWWQNLVLSELNIWRCNCGSSCCLNPICLQIRESKTQKQLFLLFLSVFSDLNLI